MKQGTRNGFQESNKVFLKSREGFKGKGECKGRDKERC
jgi:hypothetical protein